MCDVSTTSQQFGHTSSSSSVILIDDDDGFRMVVMSVESLGLHRFSSDMSNHWIAANEPSCPREKAEMTSSFRLKCESCAGALHRRTNTSCQGPDFLSGNL